MQTYSIVIVSNDDSFSTELQGRLAEAGYDVTIGSAAAVTHERIRASRPSLIVLDLLESTSETPPIEDAIEDDPAIRDIPILLCSDDAELLPDRVKGSTQATGPVQASTRSIDEIVAKARWILHS